MTEITSIKTSETVSLPGWCGEPFECELRRPSILALAARGALTNPLMKTARRLFYAGISADEGNLEEEGRVLTEIARAAMVRPSFDELEQRNIELTDEQLVAIFQFTQVGAAALARFREFGQNHESADHGASVPDSSK